MGRMALSVSVRLVWWIASEMSEIDMFRCWVLNRWICISGVTCIAALVATTAGRLTRVW